MKFMRNAVLALLASGFMLVGVQGAAQDYPSKPIRLIVPFAPGGGTELIAFLIRDGLNARWKEPVVVDSRPGGTGALAAGIILNAPADGYTMMLVTSSTHAIFPNVAREPPFDPVKDFSGVILAATAPNILFVHPSIGANSVKELVALAKSKPGVLNFGSPGIGTVGHLAWELFQSVTGTKLTHVPYKGSGTVLRALLGGEVHLGFSGPGSALAQVRAKKLKMIASGMPQRLSWLDLPTFVEAGYPTMKAYNWYGIVAKAGTPASIINKLNAEMKRILEQSETVSIMLKRGYIATTTTPAEFDKLIHDDNEKWRKVVKDSVVQVD